MVAMIAEFATGTQVNSHVIHRPYLTRLPVLDEALAKAQVRLADIGCIAVLNTPGWVGALLVGVSAAKMLALALEVPLVDPRNPGGAIFHDADQSADQAEPRGAVG